MGNNENLNFDIRVSRVKSHSGHIFMAYKAIDLSQISSATMSIRKVRKTISRWEMR